ncbi:MAG: hypothetical protein LBC99_03495 [Spirochaetota bacterium]|jgi:hypothetical protein|nr:hypothetical protein [Spirochaetota bacterium]
MCRSLLCLAFLFFPFLLSGTRAYLGDAASAAVFGTSGDDAGLVLELYTAKNKNPLFDCIAPIIIQQDGASIPMRTVTEDRAEQNTKADFEFREGAEYFRFTHTEAIDVSAAFCSYTDGVYVWQITLSNVSACAQSFHSGLAMSTGSAKRLAFWKAEDAQLAMLVDDQALAFGAASAHPLRYTSALAGASAYALPARDQGYFSLTAEITLETNAQTTLAFVLALGSGVSAAQKKCAEWMRLAALDTPLREKRRTLWRDWLGESRMPEYAVPSMQSSFMRALFSLDIMRHHEALIPGDISVLLDSAEAMRVCGRDSAALFFIARASSMLAKEKRNFGRLAEDPDNRMALARYASLASRLTITSGKLAGDLEIARLALDAIAGRVLQEGASASPAEAVVYAAAANDAALLLRLSRDETSASRMEKYAAAFREYGDALYSEEALGWTDAFGMPDARVFTFLYDHDARITKQYQIMRPLARFLPARDQAYLLCAAARNLDREYLGNALPGCAESLAALAPPEAMALRLIVLGEGALYGCLDEENAYSDYRLERLYRTLLELRHTSKDAAASFLFRELRSRIRDKLDAPRERDEAFMASLMLDSDKLRAELERFALSAPLERLLTTLRLDQTDAIIIAMALARQGIWPQARVSSEFTFSLSLPEGTELDALPASWRAVSSAAGSREMTLYAPETGSGAAEYAALTHRVARGGQEKKWSEPFLLSHPHPLITYAIIHSPLNGRFIIHNRSRQFLEIMSVQGAVSVLSGEVPYRIAPESAVALAINLVTDLPQVQLLVTAKQADTLYRADCEPVTPRDFIFDTLWYTLSAGGSRQNILNIGDASELERLDSGFPEDGITIAKVFRAPKGGNAFGVRTDQTPWRLSMNNRLLKPVRRGDWYWYDLGGRADPELCLSFRRHEDMILFAESEKRLAGKGR